MNHNQPNDNIAVVITENIQKKYKKLLAVDNVNLQLEAGDIFGLVGANGSGKTTLLKMLATVIKPTSGTAKILGYDIRKPRKIRKSIGYMPKFYADYDLKVWEYMSFFAGAYKIPKSERKGIINDVLELTDLASAKSRYIKELSDGMMQKLGIARTLINDPSILLLDEPACCLDPKSRTEIMEILKELGNMGKTLIISSGIISDILSICNKIGIMKEGKLIISGNIEDLNISDYL